MHLTVGNYYVLGIGTPSRYDRVIWKVAEKITTLTAHPDLHYVSYILEHIAVIKLDQDTQQEEALVASLIDTRHNTFKRYVVNGSEITSAYWVAVQTDIVSFSFQSDEEAVSAPWKLKNSVMRFAEG